MESTLASAARARGDDSRERLLAAAAKMFAARGYDGVSVRELATAARVNVAAVSYHFGGKRGLYLAALEDLMEEMAPVGRPVIDRVDAAFADGAPDRRDLARLASFVVRHFVTSMLSGELPPWVVQTVLREFQQPTADYRPMFDERVLPLHQAVARMVAACIEVEPQSAAAILASHAFMGQTMVYAAARTVVLEELNWPDFGGERLEAVVEAAEAAALRSLGLDRPTETS